MSAASAGAPARVHARTAQTAPTSTPPRLTEAQWRVAALVAKGMTNREIARQLYISESTVKNHVARSMASVGAANRVQLALFVLGNRRGPRPQHRGQPSQRSRAARSQRALGRGAWVRTNGIVVWAAELGPADSRSVDGARG